jgi:hypothetical protein
MMRESILEVPTEQTETAAMLRPNAFVKQFVQFAPRCNDFDGRKKAPLFFAHFVPFCGYSLSSQLFSLP